MSRLHVQRLLGLIWLLDGLMQLKPEMFTKDFINQVILPTADSQPAWINHSITWAANFTMPHIAVWNALFALVQIALGIGLLMNRRLRLFLTASFVWTLLVWWFGEGFGQILTGQTLLLSGAPGAVLLYGLIGVAVWPADDSRFGSSSQWTTQGLSFARYSMGILWLIGSGLHLQQAYLNSKGFLDAISVPWVSQMIGTHGVAVSLSLAVLELLLGLSFILKFQLKVTTWVSIVLSALYWWIGQSFGQVFEPLATDFNSGLLLMLLSLTANPSIFSVKTQRTLRLYTNPSH